MRKRSHSLKKFLAIAAADEQRTGKLAGQIRRELDDHIGRLGELNAFRHDYLGKAPASGSLNSAHFKDYQSFLARLDAAVNAQQQIVADSEQNLELHRQRWLQKRQRLESLERVLERYQQEEQEHEERLEQRILDDLPSGPLPYDEDDA
ncbi:MAG: flagellar export protein FliJ [Pseudomonadota bacterium]